MERRTIPKNEKIGRSTARWKLLILQTLLLALDDEESITTIAHSLNENGNEISDVLWICKDPSRGIQGRIWEIVRNNKNWFNEYTLKPQYISSPQWLADFRIPYQIFKELSRGVGPSLMSTTPQLGISLEPSKKIAAFLMWTSDKTCSDIAGRLGIGVSTMTPIIRTVSSALCEYYGHVIALPTTRIELERVMKGFKDIAGLPYCVGAIDGSHLRGNACPSDQYLDYKCFKNFTSLIVFGICDSKKRFIYADVGAPGVLGDATLYRSSVQRFVSNLPARSWDIP